MHEEADKPRRLRAGLLAAIAVIGVAIATAWTLKRSPDPPKFLTARVEQGAITSVVQATGTINPLTTVPVGSDVSGTVKYIFADFNSRVRAGQVLAQLDPEVYQAQVTQARGNVENAIANEKNLEAAIAVQEAVIQTNAANLEKAKAAAEYAKATAQRYQKLTQDGVISRDQAEQLKSGMDQADAQVRATEAQWNQSRAQLAQSRAQLEQAQAQVMTAQGSLDLAQTNLRDCTILSPIDGTVVARNVTVGQSVAASLQAPVVFSIAQDLARMQLYASTDESDTGSIKIGTEATFQVDAFPSDTFRGRVSAIRLNATTVQNVVTYNTVIDFENLDGRLLPGETAYATIPTGHVEDCIKVPNSALRFTPNFPPQQIQQLYRTYGISTAATSSHAGSRRVVWKLEEGGIRPVAVQVGITDYTYTQLVSGNVRPGDVLAAGEEQSGPEGSRSSSTPKFGAPRR